RLLNPNLRPIVKEKMEEYIRGITEGMGGTYEFNYLEGIPSVKNDISLIPNLEKVVEDILGKDKLLEVKPSMGGVDLSYDTKEIASIFFRLGTSGGDDT